MLTPSGPVPTPPPVQSAPLEVITPVRIQERRAFGFLALLALAILVRLAMPVGIGLFLGSLLGFTLEPIYGRLRRRQFKAGPAALLCALGATLVVSSTVLALTTLIVTRGIALLGSLREQLAPGGALRAFAEGAAGRLAALHVNVADVSQRLENEAVSLGFERSRRSGVRCGADLRWHLDALLHDPDGLFRPALLERPREAG